jgi:hypothetical protein
MLAWLFPPAFHDAQLGSLTRARGRWRGSLEPEPGVVVPLAVAGTRRAPDPEALAEARTVTARLVTWRSVIARALLDHYEPYAEAVAAGEVRLEGCPPSALTGPDDVWPHVVLLYVAVYPLDGALTTELGYSAAWDGEHTLGACFQGDRFAELCGSVGPAQP